MTQPLQEASDSASAPVLSYGRTARVFHWSVAALFLGSYCTVYYRHWFTQSETPANWISLQLHLSCGISIAVFVLLRILWRLGHPPPPSLPAPRREHVAAHGVHYLLYFFMILMPLTGYLGTGVATEFFGLFEVPKFADTPLFAFLVEGLMGLSFEEFEAPVDFIHKKSGAWLVWMLILLHASAALYHHFVRRDEVLLRMWPGLGRRKPGRT